MNTMNKRKSMIIDGRPVAIEGEKNILDVIRKAGIDMPTLCYHSNLSTYGACRMCVVEGNRGEIMASCSTPPKAGMEIKTNTPRLQKYRKMVLELMLADHCRECTTCEKNFDCELQTMAMKFGLKDIRFENYSIGDEKAERDNSSYSIVRSPNKCIICGDCVRMCSEIQNVGAIDFAHRGSNVEVTTAFDMPLAETNCVNCGQCAAICPTGALVIKSNVDEVWKDIYDPEVKVVAQIAPAVRVALGDEFDLPKGTNVMGKIVGAMKRLGFDEVYDTSTAADLTVIEEANELLAKIKSGNTEMPLFTSCCPAWMKYAEDNHPELVPYISSCKSPMGMMSSVIKAKDARDNEGNKKAKKTKVVAVMPCTAKKFEIHREDQMLDGEQATDHSITTVELADMIRSAGLRFEDVLPEAVEMPYGIASGAGVIFGVTGGVTEAAIRYVIGDRNQIADIAFTGVRGFEGLKEVKIPLDEAGENILSVAIVSGLKNTENLIKAIQAGEVHYDFVEVMACEGGCIAGGGQPFVIGRAKEERSAGIYEADRMSGVRMSADNPVTEALYKNLLTGKAAHHLLHYK